MNKIQVSLLAQFENKNKWSVFFFFSFLRYRPHIVEITQISKTRHDKNNHWLVVPWLDQKVRN